MCVCSSGSERESGNKIEIENRSVSASASENVTSVEIGV